jgi:hypothetical protein
MSKERPQISLPPEMRCEQIEEREREHHTAGLHQLWPLGHPLGKRTNIKKVEEQIVDDLTEMLVALREGRMFLAKGLPGKKYLIGSAIKIVRDNFKKLEK